MSRPSPMVAAIAFLVLPATGHAQAARPSPSPSPVAAALEALSAAVGRPGIGSAIGLIARRDQILLLTAAGEIGPGDPMPVNAIVRTASIGKPVTAAAVMMLVERGLLDLADPVSRWFPGFGERVLTPEGDTVPAQRPPTVRDLLTHQAGVVSEGPDFDDLWEAPTTREFAKRMGAIPLRFQPGSRFEYGCCGSGYEVLAAIVVEVSRQSFRDFLSAKMFLPLRMTDTDFRVAEGKRHRLAAHYGVDSSGALVRIRGHGQEEPETDFHSGGGGLRSTVLDFHRFALMLLNGGELDGVRLLRPESVRLMTTNQVEDRYPAAGYGWGFGVRVRTAPASEGSAGPGAWGWNGGTGTQFEVDPGSGMIAIVFAPVWPGRAPGVNQVRAGFMAAAVAALIP